MGKIFKNDGEYKSKYYSRKPTDRQRQALQDWNALVKEVGKQAALAKKKAERGLKSGKIDRYQKSGVVTHEAVSAVMDLVAEGNDRDRLRDDPNLMYSMVDYSEKLIGESEAERRGLLTYDQLDALLEQWGADLDAAAQEPLF